MSILKTMTLLAFSVSALEAAQGNPEGMQIELRALQTRRSLNSGRVKLSVVRTKGKRNGYDHLEFFIRFDGDKVCTDKVMFFKNGLRLVERRVFNGSEFIYDSGQEDENIRIRDLSHRGASFEDDLFHPNILGVYPMPIVHLDNHTVEDILTQPDRKDETVESEIIDGRKVKHISYRKTVGSWAERWIASDQTAAVMKVQTTGKNGVYQSSVESQYALFPGDIWFPRTIVYRSVQNKRLVDEEVVKVELAEFNVEIDPSLFTLAAFDLKQGEVVRRNGRDLVWNGRALVSFSDAHNPFLNENFAQAPSRVKNWLFLANAVLLATVAGFFLFRGMKKKPVA